MSSAMPWVSCWPCVPLANKPQNVPMIELTACPPSAGSPSTSATLRPSRAASSAADTPAMPAPSTQMSADTCRGVARCGRRTIRVAVDILVVSVLIAAGASMLPAQDTDRDMIGELRFRRIGCPPEHHRALDLAAPLEDFHRYLLGVA